MTDSKGKDALPESGGAATEGTEEPIIHESRRAAPDFLNLVISFVVSAIVSAASLFVYDMYFAQKVVSIDLKGYMESQKAQYMTRKINDDQLDRNIAHVKDVVGKIPKNRVVLMGDAVVKNAEVVKIEPIK